MNDERHVSVHVGPHMRQGAILLAALLLANGCTHSNQSAGSAERGGPGITFLVASAQSSEALPGAEVFCLSGNSPPLSLGKTGLDGAFVVGRDHLKRIQPVAVVICADYFTCAALDVWRRPDFFDYLEHYVKLAPVSFLAR